MLRRLVVDLIDAEPDMRTVGSVATVTQALAELEPGTVDVAMLDIVLDDGNGIALGTTLQRRDPRLRVMVLSAHNMVGVVRALRSPGTEPWSYLSKKSSLDPHELPRALRAVAAGRLVIDPWLVRRSRPRHGSALEALTRTQLEVLALVAEGFSNAAVGARLAVTIKTVESHLTAIYRGLDVAHEKNPRVEAVLQFLELTAR